MYEEIGTEKMNEIVFQINHINDVFRLVRLLERKFDFVSTIVTRGDVEAEYGDMWEYEGDGRREMTEAQWEEFSHDWFWSKGHADIMWDGIPNAIRWDLRERGLVPETAVVE